MEIGRLEICSWFLRVSKGPFKTFLDYYECKLIYTHTGKKTEAVFSPLRSNEAHSIAALNSRTTECTVGSPRLIRPALVIFGKETTSRGRRVLLSHTPQHSEMTIGSFDKRECLKCSLTNVHNLQPQSDHEIKLNLFHSQKMFVPKMLSGHSDVDYTVAGKDIKCYCYYYLVKVKYFIKHRN